MIRKELGLSENLKCLLIYDVFKAQRADKHREHFDKNNIAYVQVLPILTHHFQSLNVSVNGFTKSSLKSGFQDWYAKEVTNGLNKGKNVHQIDIDTKLSKMKQIHAQWLISLYNKLRNSGKMIKSAFQNVSIMEVIGNKEISDDDRLNP